MTIGAGTFLPQARFAFPRSFIYDFYVFRNGDTVVQTANKFVVTDTANPLLTATFVMALKFYAWTSNGWTMDHVIVESYYQNTPGGTQFALPYNLIFKLDPVTLKNSLYLGWSGLTSDPQLCHLPQQPSDYWLPKPLP